MTIRGVPGVERPVVQWLLLALSVLIIVLAALVVRRQRASEAVVGGLRQELDQAVRHQAELELQVQRERAARESFQISLEQERGAGGLPGIALEPGLSPSGLPTQQLRVPPDARRVPLVLPLPPQRYEHYRAALRPFTGGDDLWVHGRLHPEGDARRLIVPVPGEVLAPGSYELALSGIGTDGRRRDLSTFTFEVVANGRRR
ncbi:MAG TPA: hypothetical protein VK886_16740 [Vicinamibacterales bacterium]|nr:hypothetical protein [Vicinamibacterales bacterium]